MGMIRSINMAARAILLNMPKVVQGTKTIIQVGGSGNNTMEAHGGYRPFNDRAIWRPGYEHHEVTGSTGDDAIKMYGGSNSDTLTYNRDRRQ